MGRASKQQCRAISRAPLFRYGYLYIPLEIAPGQGVARFHDFPRRTRSDHGAAVGAGAGTQVNHIIRGADGVLVVLDHDNCIAYVAQPFECCQKFAVIALM